MTAFQLLIFSHWTVYPIHLIDSLIEVSYKPPLALLARTKRFSSRMHVCTLCQELNPSRGMSSRELSINIRALGEDVDAWPTPPLRSCCNACGGILQLEMRQISSWIELSRKAAVRHVCLSIRLLTDISVVHPSVHPLICSRAPAVCTALISPVHWGRRQRRGCSPGGSRLRALRLICKYD